jgi:hypothetical protein
MPRKKFIKKQIIEVNGKKVEVSIFGTTIKPGEENVLKNIDDLLKEEKIENIVKDIFMEIEKIAIKYPHKKKNLKYYYDVGKMLQFVDEKGFTDMRGLIWERMSHDFNPELFGGKKQDRSESKRHPEFMYLLAKVDKKYLSNANWDQWYEILKFKEIYKIQNLLEEILLDCKNNKLSGIPLRNKIKKLRNLEL